MDQHGIARLHRAALVDQVLRRHALEHGGGGLLEADRIGQPDQRIGRDGAKPRIGAGRRTRVGDAVALLERRHRTAHGLHDARALEAHDPGQPRRGKGSATLIGVEEVEPDRPLHNPRLGGAGIRHPEIVDPQHLRPAGRVHSHGLRLDRQAGAGAVLLPVHRGEDAGELALAGVDRAEGHGRRRRRWRLDGRRRIHGMRCARSRCRVRFGAGPRPPSRSGWRR